MTRILGKYRPIENSLESEETNKLINYLPKRTYSEHSITNNSNNGKTYFKNLGIHSSQNAVNRYLRYTRKNRNNNNNNNNNNKKKRKKSTIKIVFPSNYNFSKKYLNWVKNQPKVK